MQHRKPTTIALILAPFVFSFAFAMDIYIPVVPEMRQVFHSNQFLIQLTLSLFILTVGLGNILVGPLSDKYGRTKVMLLATQLFIIGSIACALAPSIWIMIFARVICALGACGMLIVSFAIVRDLFSGNKGAQLFSWLNAAIGISPTFAPILGGHLAAWFGWRSVFWFLAILGIAVLIISLLLIRETLHKENRSNIDLEMFKRYFIILLNKNFLRYMLVGAAGVSICFSFFSISPFIIMSLLHISQQDFGYYFAVFGIVLILGGILSGRLVTKIGLDATIKWGIGLMCFGGLSMLLTNLCFGLYIALFLPSVAIACTGAIFCIGSAAAGAMEPFPDYAGTAAAALQAGQFIIASIIGTILMHFPVQSSMTYAVCILLVGFLSIIILYSTRR